METLRDVYDETQDEFKQGIQDYLQVVLHCLTPFTIHPSLCSRIPRPKSQTWNHPETQTLDPETRNPKP